MKGELATLKHRQYRMKQTTCPRCLITYDKEVCYLSKYKLFLVEPGCCYSGNSVVSAADSKEANEIIQNFKDQDIDNIFDSKGYNFVDDNNIIEGAIGIKKGFLYYGIRYSG